MSGQKSGAVSHELGQNGPCNDFRKMDRLFIFSPTPTDEDDRL
jgi:hypothetical protein